MRHIARQPLQTFTINKDGKRRSAMSFQPRPGMIPISKIIKTYPNGIDVRDAAWILNRMLGALMVPYQSNLIHGAVVPDNFLVDTDSHDGCLIDWAFAVNPGQIITNVSGTYLEYYPSEVIKKMPAHKSIDLYMAVMCFIKLIGGNVETKECPAHTPNQVKNLLRACLLPAKNRVCDPFELFEDFKEVLAGLYGPPKFRVFPKINN